MCFFIIFILTIKVSCGVKSCQRCLMSGKLSAFLVFLLAWCCIKAGQQVEKPVKQNERENSVNDEQHPCIHFQTPLRKSFHFSEGYS